jgi:fructokinase
MTSTDNDHNNPIYVAAVEGGGTSFRVAICQIELPTNSTTADPHQDEKPPKILHRIQIDSSGDDPQICLRHCADFLRKHIPPAHGYQALGVACFGPLGVKPDTPEYGTILPSTPKASWRNVNVLQPLQEACRYSPTILETDVNAPAFSEYRAANQKRTLQSKISSCAYVTVGTGVGVGLIVNGKPVHGRMHPEGGHVTVFTENDDEFGGYSWGRDPKARVPYRGIRTVEGLASSVALLERYQQSQNNNKNVSSSSSRDSLKDVPDDCVIWDHAANALANLCATLLLTLSMERIVLGGGVMQRGILYDKIRHRTKEILNGYLDLGTDPDETLRNIIVASEFGEDAGLVGACVLAKLAYEEHNRAASLLENDDNDDDGAPSTKRIKQLAFQTGLMHGIIVGSVATALVIKYAIWPNSRSRHR